MIMQYKYTPYWRTLQPIIDSGAMQAAINGTYRYPHRINLYPGTSCMFKCVFCGRNYDAKTKDTQNVFAQVIDQDDGKDPDRINISGGLEPLTSPYINDICKRLYDKGARPRMITNGFLLNDKTLSKNPYINSLHHIRVSLYGIDEDETVSTTRHPKAYEVVRQNLKTYNQHQDKTKLYLNYVLLPQHYDRLHKIIEYVEHIGGVENISLREDFTFQYEIADRERLRERLLEFDAMVKGTGVNIDYGYSLQELLDGKQSTLMRVSHEQLTPRQAPQVKVCVDPRGEIYSHLEAGFIDRPGALRHSHGNVVGSSIEEQLKKCKTIAPMPGDTQYMDAFNHLVAKYIHTHR